MSPLESIDERMITLVFCRLVFCAREIIKVIARIISLAANGSYAVASTSLGLLTAVDRDEEKEEYSDASENE